MVQGEQNKISTMSWTRVKDRNSMTATFLVGLDVATRTLDDGDDGSFVRTGARQTQSVCLIKDGSEQSCGCGRIGRLWVKGSGEAGF